MTEDEKRERYEELMDELIWITFFSKKFSPGRVDKIVEEMEALFPTPEGKIFEGKYLSMLEELFNQEMEEDEELIRDSDDDVIVENDEAY